MTGKMLVQILVAILAIIHLAGCPRHLVPPDTREGSNGRTAASGVNADEPRAEAAGGITAEVEDTDSVDFRPAPLEQLQAAMLGLESFRVFGYHFKIHNDTKMLQSMRKPTFEYIARHIDPHLKLKKIKYDPTHQIYIASFLYLKAYVFWVYGDTDAARKTIAVLNRTFPDKHRDITIHHVDRGRVALDDALYDLEELIGPKPN